MEYLEYKGYKGTIEYSKEDSCFYGKVQGMGKKHLILYEGTTIEELQKDFKTRIDSYLEGSINDGIESVTPLAEKQDKG